MFKIYIHFFLIIIVLFASCSRSSNKIIHKKPLIDRHLKDSPASKVQNRYLKLKRLSSNEENRPFTKRNGIEEYLIGIGDILQISVWKKNRTEAYSTPVKSDGTISFLFLDKIGVNRLTTSEVTALVTKRLKKFYKNPRVDVSVKEFHSKFIYLFGEVTSGKSGEGLGHGKYPLKGKTTLIDLILSAGGYTKDADISKINLNRGKKRYLINLYKGFQRGSKALDIYLESGDIVLIPSLKGHQASKKTVYIIGEVKRPGTFTYTEKIGLVKALAMAGGVTPNAIDESIRVIRGDINNPTIIASNIDSYFKKADIKQNIPLKNGDIVYVPHSKIKDIKNFFSNIQPILQAILYPGLFRDLYTTGGGLRIDTGEQNTGGTTVLPSR